MNSEKPRVVGGVIIWIQWQGCKSLFVAGSTADIFLQPNKPSSALKKRTTPCNFWFYFVF